MGLKTLMKQDSSFQWKDILFVGDSMGTDIRTSIENGIVNQYLSYSTILLYSIIIQLFNYLKQKNKDCALVMSGTTTPEKLNRSALQPNYVFPSIKEVYVALAAGQMSTRLDDE